MKLDDLLLRDSTSYDPNDWSCSLMLGPLKGTLAATLIDGYTNPNGSVHLRFEYRAIADYTLIGYTVMRIWWADGSIKIRTVRSDVWTPAHVVLAGSVIEIELDVEPAEWA